MTKRRWNWMAAAGLLLGTCLAAAMSRGGAAPAGGVATVVTRGGKDGPVSFRGTLDRTAVLRGSDGTARIELVMAADDVADTSRSTHRATDLVIVLDRSGSMSGDKIAHALGSVRELVGQLRDEDRFALVSYASDSQVDLPLTPVAHGREQLERTLGNIFASGGTNMSAGLDLGLNLIDNAGPEGRAQRVPRLILISDGHANEGDPSPHGLTERARRAARGEYMLSAVGVGADFNEYLMAAIADAGTGNYYYVRHAEDLGSVFASEFDAARTTVASGLAVRIEPAPGVRLVDAAGYPIESDGSAYVVRPGALFAGQERRIWLTLGIPNQEIRDYPIGRFTLAYAIDGAPRELHIDDLPRIACVAGEDEFYAGVDVDAWGRSVSVDQYNAMQKDVAEAVAEGDRPRAMQRLESFRHDIRTKNEVLQAPAADASLADLDGLEAEVKEAFEGDLVGRVQRQNDLSKAKSAAAMDERRVGAKKASVP